MHEKTGLLVEAENLDSLTSTLQEFIQDPARRQKMGVTSRQRVDELYGWENTAKDYAALLEDISKRP